MSKDWSETALRKYRMDPLREHNAAVNDKSLGKEEPLNGIYGGAKPISSSRRRISVRRVIELLKPLNEIEIEESHFERSFLNTKAGLLIHDDCHREIPVISSMAYPTRTVSSLFASTYRVARNGWLAERTARRSIMHFR
jgi:hypothetical protein